MSRRRCTPGCFHRAVLEQALAEAKAPAEDAANPQKHNFDYLEDDDDLENDFEM